MDDIIAPATVIVMINVILSGRKTQGLNEPSRESSANLVDQVVLISESY